MLSSETEFRPIITLDGTIENLNHIISKINQCDDAEFLQEYLDSGNALIKANDPSARDLEKINTALEARLTSLKETYATGDTYFNDIVTELINGTPVLEEQMDFIRSYMDIVLNNMIDDKVPERQLELARKYIKYLAARVDNPGLSSAEHAILYRFSSMDNMNKAIQFEDAVKKRANRQAVVLKKVNKNAAFIKSIAVIEIVVLLGILIAIIALVRN